MNKRVMVLPWSYENSLGGWTWRIYERRPFLACSPTMMLIMHLGHLNHLQRQVIWSQDYLMLHMNIPELLAILLPCMVFLPVL